MSEKSNPAGWVVQVIVPAPPAPPTPDAVRWLGPAMSGAPLFKYFNVAIGSADKALEATTKHMAKNDIKDGEISVVRRLSPAEIALLKLEAGAIKPA